MSKLKDILKGFKPEFSLELDNYKLDNKCFHRLAEAFLYGGFISVSDHEKERYRIFIRTVEIYCHHEGGENELPKDPIVYHRNGRYVEDEVPYFPLMSFHAHASGIDITFENPELKLRSSALIRAYEVYDVIREKFLHYDKTKTLFVSCENPKDRVNKQSTYLYDFLNGFGSNNIVWKDARITEYHKGLKTTTRQNVYKYIYDKDKNDWIKQNTKDPREWSFTRLDEIVKIED